MQLETERLILRDFVMDDVDALAACRADERYWRFYDEPDDIRDNAREHVELFVGWQDAEPRTHFQLAITLKESGRLIGDCGLRRRDEVAFGFSALSEADIGYELDPSYWGRGYATEAVRTLVDFGFTRQGLDRVWTYCIADNERSWRLMERIGMRREGLLKQNVQLRDRRCDTAVYAILKEEWAGLST
ncbi:MAG TPA: GNAT family protein [Dehalococcoidia bacterium]|nr:GNAT family protein [Dehalococcoidia bacterium]